MPLKNLKLFGKSTQVTTTGKNLFDFSKIKNIGGQGKYDIDYERQTITIPANTNNVGYVDTMRELCPEATAGKMYVLSCNTSNSEASQHIYLLKAGRVIIFGKAFEWSDEMLDDKFAWYNSVKTNNENVISEIQFEEGTVATDYEPYTGGKPSPSPEYPQEIISAGDSGNIEVDVTGKNLIDIQNIEVTWGHTINNLQKINNYIGETMTFSGIFEVTAVSNDESPDYYEFRMLVQQLDNAYVPIFSERFYSKPVVGQKVIFSQTIDITQKIKKILLYGFGRNLIGTLGTSKATVQIELGGVATPYKPFKKSTFDFATPNGLRGIPVDSNGNYTDESGQQWICDEVDFERGVYIQRAWTGELDGSDDENWGTYESPKYLGFVADILPEKANRRRGFCNYYIVQEEKNASDAESLWLGVSGNTRMYLHNSRFYDTELSDKGLSNFKAYLAEHPMIVMTYLDNPVETPLTADQIAAYKSLTTHKTTTLISNDTGAGMEVTYAADPKAYIDNKFAELSQAIVASASEAE